jgi:hypothetical protein
MDGRFLLFAKWTSRLTKSYGHGWPVLLSARWTSRVTKSFGHGWPVFSLRETDFA